MKIETQAVHIGVNKDQTFNSVITPIYPSSTFRFEAIGESKGYDYTRSGNPTRHALEENIASLECGEKAFSICTGIAAEVAILHLLSPGDHVITGDDIYGGTYRLMDAVVGKKGIEFDFINMRNIEEVKKSFKPNTKMVWIETPSNPLLNLVDIEKVVALSHENHALSVVDNTFLSPYFQKPLTLGVDIVIHSTTKYINGHSDVVGGAVVLKNDPDLIEKMGFFVNALGLGESPFDSWLVLRGVKTLPLRMKAHEKNALKIASYLEKHPKVKRVYYPGLNSHPQRELAGKQMTGYGGMLSFDLDTSKQDLNCFFSKLKYFSLAESLGGVESLIESPWYMSHASMPETVRKKAGILPENVRISAGIENSEDLIKDLDEGLA